ncbi:MAG: CPBP family glutamic-type intramembrane protease [Cyanobacteriota bacterium]|nr:CPBP family glutamic-type intramembrane protease [Cyanobacteriota bacterium]
MNNCSIVPPSQTELLTIHNMQRLASPTFLLSIITIALIIVAIAILFSSPIHASNDEVSAELPFSRPNYYPLEQTVDPTLYQPNGNWIGRLILPPPEVTQQQDWVEIELYHTPDEYRELVGQTLRLEWSSDPKLQAYLDAVKTEVKFSAATRKSQQKGNIHPQRLDGRSSVSSLQSLAGARLEDDVIVSLSQVVVRNNEKVTLLQIEREPVQITGLFYGLVQLLKPEEANSPLCPEQSPHLCEFRVRHYNAASRQFDGPEEIVKIPQYPLKKNGLFPSTTHQLEHSPAGELGWYIYGAKNSDGVFVVQALRSRSLFQLQPDRVISDKLTGIRYIQRQNWQDTEARKGTIQKVLVDVTAQNTRNAIAKWKEGDREARFGRHRALVVHLFGGIGGKKAESMLPGTVTGHFSYGVAEVVREPIADELQFSIQYQQVYAHNPDGIIAGTMAWENYMGDLQRGWLATRPVSDILIRFDAVTENYNFDGIILSPLGELEQQLAIINARYRTGDGTGAAIVTPATSCAQDSNQALYIAIERIKQQVNETPAIVRWLDTHPDDGQTQRFQRLVALGKALEAELVPLGVVRPDWKYNARGTISLAGIETNSRFASAKNLLPALLSWRTIFPRRAHDEIGRIFLQQGAALWFLRANQVGGWDEDILPLAPTVLLGKFPIAATILGRLLTAVTVFPTVQGWLWVVGITVIYSAIALPLGLASGFLAWELAIDNGKQLAIEAFYLFVTPALVEEVFFRVLLLPHPTEGIFPMSWALWAIASLLLFLAYHPLNALWFYRLGNPLFFKPMFLVLAGLLGVACTVVYGLTGSLWGIVLIHWLVVGTWLFGLGGKRKLAVKPINN